MNGKFKTLTHYGPLFPKEFEPKGLSVNNVKLSPLAEEMLYAYAQKIETEYIKSDVFNKNFYSCFSKELPRELKSLSFPDDFLPVIKNIRKYQVEQKEKKDEWNKAHKKEIEQQKKEIKEKYGYAMLNGEKQPIGSYMIEGPSIFIARGNSPILGLWKYRTQPEDVVINYVGDKSGIPQPPEGHHWKEVVSDTNAMHTVVYSENIGNKTTKIKEIRFGNASTVKADADKKKFNKAVKLLQHMDEMTKYIQDNLTNTDKLVSECALISWLLQTTGIRIGNERDEEIQAADVVGASTLKKENIWAENGKLYLHFIGKDSIEFKNEYDIPKYIESAITKLRKSKKDGDNVFTATSSDVNNFLGKCVEGCTPKLWRTAIATKLLVDALKSQKIKKGWSTSEKLHAFDLANLEVAKKLNHKKNVSKNFGAQVSKMNETLESKESKYKELESKAKKDIAEIDDKIKTAQSVWSGKELEDAVKRLNSKKKAIKSKLDKSAEKIEETKTKMEFKQQTGDIALGTSKANYASPQIVYSFCSKYDVPIDKIYSKTLQEKFKWASDTKSTYFDSYPFVNI